MGFTVVFEKGDWKMKRGRQGLRKEEEKGLLELEREMGMREFTVAENMV